MKINEMIQSRVAAREMEDKRLMEAWSPILNAATEYLKKHDNRELSEHEKRQIARVCENALLNAASSSSKRLFETTRSVVRWPVMASCN